MTKLLLIAGAPSHGPGAHEHRAGALLLQRCLRGVPDLEVQVHTGGWVADEHDLQTADAVAIYADGGTGHPILVEDRLVTLGRLMDRGVGFALMHWAVELPVDHGAPQVDKWIGGHYEDLVSCNPMWNARFEQLPDHPITRGVASFETYDEWYFNIRSEGGALANEATVRADAQFSPILVATPTDLVRHGPYVWPHGPYPGVVAASGRPETLLWTLERPDGGRGFGLAGGHYHANWRNDAFRTTVLNALVWLTGADVPAGGVASEVSAEDLSRYLDDQE
ncbi:MAG: ThuA domain-containing protein [Chloroflexi bacterium]|nr:ThuA domain-containing protein [Chloroflexota bacterium]